MRYVIATILIIRSAFSFSQVAFNNLNFYTAKDGLTNNTIYALAKDSRGFLWVGTKEGLNRFDGLQFKKYFAAKDISHSLAGNNIFSILEYRYGQLLIATNNGISVLNTLTGNFENGKIHTPQLRMGSGTLINSFFKDAAGKIWVNENGEIDILDSNLTYMERFTDRPWAKSLKGVLVRFEDWETDRAGRIWLPSDTTGINIIDFKAKQVWSNTNNPDGFSFLKSRYMRSMLLDEKTNTLWYAPWGLGLFKYDLSTNTEQQQLFNIKNAGEARSINSIIKSNSGKLICASGRGLYGVDPVTLNYTRTDDQYDAISLYRDNGSGYYWLGTDEGLFQFSDTSFVKNIVVNTDRSTNKYCYNILNSRSGNLYAVYNNDLIEVKNDRVKFTGYSLPGSKHAQYTELAEDKKGRLWIGSSDGVILFDETTKKFSPASFLPATAKHIFCNKIFCDADGYTWLTSRSPLGIFRVNQHDSVEVLTGIVMSRFADSYGPRNNITDITEDMHHNIWMISGIGGGILCYNRSAASWELFPGPASKNDILRRKGFVYLNAVGPFLWLTDFYGTGLMRYDPGKDEVVQFTRNDGLLSDYILSMNYDGKENFRLITEKGITQFNTRTFKTRNFSISNISFPSYDYVTSTYDSIGGGIAYGEKNIISFMQAGKIPFTSPPLPVINSISVFNKEKFIDPEKKFNLEYDENNLAIDFTAIRFHDADKVRFAYRLTGADGEWQYADVNRAARYSNLAPGNYAFEIKTGDENDLWSPVFTLLNFRISPPFWHTWWFIASLATLVFILVYLLVKNRISQIRHEAGLKHKIAETEMMALRAQMNPHFIFNCMTAIDNLIQTNQKDKATAYLARFAKLIRAVLESSKNNVIPFYREYEALDLFLQLERFRCSDKFQYILDADEVMLSGDYKVPPLLIQPFIENAIHHGLLNKPGRDKKLCVQIGIEKERIKYTVTDNGIGRQKAMELKNKNKPEHVSYGIRISTDRIHLYNQKIKENDIVITDLYENGVPAGTRVEVFINIYYS